MRRYTRWLAWLIAFLILEGEALTEKQPRPTLTGFVRWLRRRHWSIHTLLVLGWAYLGFHFFLEK